MPFSKKSRLRREKIVFYVLRHDFTLLKIAQIHTNMHVSGNRGSIATYIIQNNNVYTNYTTISTYTSHSNSRRRRAKKIRSLYDSNALVTLQKIIIGLVKPQNFPRAFGAPISQILDQDIQYDSIEKLPPPCFRMSRNKGMFVHRGGVFLRGIGLMSPLFSCVAHFF